MGAIAGFPNWQKNQPAPSPEQVGQLLMQRSMQPPGGAMPQPGAAVSGQGAVETAGPQVGEPDPHAPAQQSDWPSATEAALKAAILRVMGPEKVSNPQVPGPGVKTQLQRLGMPDDQLAILRATQGVNIA